MRKSWTRVRINAFAVLGGGRGCKYQLVEVYEIGSEERKDKNLDLDYGVFNVFFYTGI